MKDEKVILISDENSASLQTVTGWVSNIGRFFGKDEGAARSHGATHMKCECGIVYKKNHYTKCQECRNKLATERYNKFEFKEWDGKTMLCTYGSDEYFFDADDIEFYLTDNDLEPSDLQLMHCEPNRFTEVTGEQWDEILPECLQGELPSNLAEQLDKLNKFIKDLPPASWGEGKFRTKYERF